VGCILLDGEAAKDFGRRRLGNHLVQRQQRPGGSWGEDGNIISGLSNVGGLSRIPSAGGPPTLVPTCRAEISATAGRKSWPEVRPCVHAWPRGASFDAAQHRRDLFGGSPHQDTRASGTFVVICQRHLIYANRAHCCCSFRRRSARSSRDAFPSTRPSRLQRAEVRTA